MCDAVGCRLPGPRNRAHAKTRWEEVKRERGGEKQVEEECGVFLTIDRVGSSILATLQPLYKYHRESPLVPVTRWCSRSHTCEYRFSSSFCARILDTLRYFSPSCCTRTQCAPRLRSLFAVPRSSSLFVRLLFVSRFLCQCQLALFATVNRPQTAIRHVPGHRSQN